jgi:epoxyqueuosine reductase
MGASDVTPSGARGCARSRLARDPALAHNAPVGREARLLELAGELGFDLAGIAPFRPPPDAARFERWIEAGRHGSMDYLARNRARIVDPRRTVPAARSLLIVCLGHARAAAALPGGGRIARYAAGRDYHNVVGRMLRRLARRAEAEGLIARGSAWRKMVDAAPLLERSHAAEAGVGFLSKAANLLHPRFGPWFFLGELALEEVLEPTAQPPAGSCGTCRACIDACPTGAILEPGLVDARACLSYHTIESRAPMPAQVRERAGPWAFGCDVCSEVCPWGRDAAAASAPLADHPAAEAPLVQWLETRDPARWSAWLEGSPLRRPGRAGLARNAAIALGHERSEEGRVALLRALRLDPSELVRDAAGWALARHGDPAARAAVERQARAEPEALRASLLGWLDRR